MTTTKPQCAALNDNGRRCRCRTGLEDVDYKRSWDGMYQYMPIRVRVLLCAKHRGATP